MKRKTIQELIAECEADTEDAVPAEKSVGTRMTCLDCGDVVKDEHVCREARGAAALKVVVHSGAGIGVTQKMSGHIHEFRPACDGNPCRCWGILPIAPPTRVLPPPAQPLPEWPTEADALKIDLPEWLE